MNFSSVLVRAVILTGFLTAAHAQNSSMPPSPVPADSTPQPPAARPELITNATDHWRVLFSPASIHYNHNPEHRPVWLLGLERQRSDSYLVGAAFFSNSFGQESGYIYGGQRLQGFSAFEPLFAQWTAGIMYGYKPPFADKVPLNYHGFSPGLVLAVGWQFTPRYSAQVNVLGNSALMLQLSAELP